MLPFGVTIPATVPQRSEIPEGLNELPCIFGSTVILNLEFVLRIFSSRQFVFDINHNSSGVPNIMNIFSQTFPKFLKINWALSKCIDDQGTKTYLCISSQTFRRFFMIESFTNDLKCLSSSSFNCPPYFNDTHPPHVPQPNSGKKGKMKKVNTEIRIH